MLQYVGQARVVAWGSSKRNGEHLVVITVFELEQPGARFFVNEKERP